MKKLLLAVAVSTIAISSVSQAWIVKGQRTTSEPAQPYITVEDCSDSLYIKLATYSSSTDRACSYGRTDLAFQQCTINLANTIGHENVEVAGHACGSTRNNEEAKCAVDLFFKGGVYILNPSLPSDGVRLCANAERNQIKKCIIEKYQSGRMAGVDAAKICLEQFDPEIRARREAELRRMEEERRRQAEAARAAEMRRQEEQRRQAELRRQDEQRRVDEQRRQDDLRKQQEEQRRKQDEARKTEEERKKQEPKPQAPKTPPKNEAPIAPKDSGDGVILDLPNFE